MDMLKSKALNLKKLPPLKALRGFEATARLLNLRKAAEELNLTHAAISHQIKLLEADIGIKLFTRQGRNIVLTDEGELFYPIVYDALDKLISGTERIKRLGLNNNLRIQTFLTFSIKWLSIKLPKLSKLHPELKFHLIACTMDTEFDELNADAGVIFCRNEPLSHLYSQVLMTPQLFIVCSPDLLPPSASECSLEELLQHPLLNVYSGAWDWQDWFTSLNITLPEISSSIGVDTTAAAIEMAINGEGIALVNRLFVENDLNAGRLVIPYKHYAESPGEWRLVCRKDMVADPKVKIFIEWMTEEAKQISLWRWP
ncbi:MAG: LysR family glycine cleavage system transcriptional activator [Flavobacterium sp.]|jgi:LysR family glycine cleavage system transcriptional activator